MIIFFLEGSPESSEYSRGVPLPPTNQRNKMRVCGNRSRCYSPCLASMRSQVWFLPLHALFYLTLNPQAHWVMHKMFIAHCWVQKELQALRHSGGAEKKTPDMPWEAVCIQQAPTRCPMSSPPLSWAPLQRENSGSPLRTLYHGNFY